MPPNALGSAVTRGIFAGEQLRGADALIHSARVAHTYEHPLADAFDFVAYVAESVGVDLASSSAVRLLLDRYDRRIDSRRSAGRDSQPVQRDRDRTVIDQYVAGAPGAYL